MSPAPSAQMIAYCEAKQEHESVLGAALQAACKGWRGRLSSTRFSALDRHVVCFSAIISNSSTQITPPRYRANKANARVRTVLLILR